MADLAIGISKSAFKLLTDKVKTAIKEEASQWQNVERDVVFITGEFEMMQSFLAAADEESIKNHVGRTWVQQVRDLADDTEDCMEFVLHLDTSKRSWWLRLLQSFAAAAEPTRPIDKAVAEMKQLIARVMDVSQRSTRYNLISSNSGSKRAAHQAAAASTRTFDILNNAAKKSGIGDLAQLITSTKGNDLQVMSVCGTDSDHGTIAGIIWKAYSDCRIREEFKCRAWVKLMDPFNPSEFIQSLRAQFYIHSRQEQEEPCDLDFLARMRATQPDVVKEFEQTTQRYLIILEDLSNMVQWDAIRPYLPDSKKGGRIIVFTHQPVIASLCTGERCQVLELRQFSTEHPVFFVFSSEEGLQHNKVPNSSTSSVRDMNEVSERLPSENQASELLELTRKHRLIFVRGMPGVGTSSVVQKMYNKSRMTNDFMEHAWVNISYPLNPVDFSPRLHLDLHPESCSSKDHPVEVFRDLLCKDGQCLIVIDGMQFKEEWEWIEDNFTKYKDKSCVVIITSEECLAENSAAVSSDSGVYHYRVKGLEPEKATNLFQQELKGLWKNKHIKSELQSILSKCGGLPKVIVTLARYLVSLRQDEFKLVQKAERLSTNFMHELETNSALRGLFTMIHSYLQACPRYLKKSMHYLSIFPQDTIIRRRRLVMRLIAEGYSDSDSTDVKSKEKYAEKRLFNELAKLNIMQPVLKENKGIGYSKVIGYKVNSFFREYIISRPTEERVFFPLDVTALNKEHGRIGQHVAIETGCDIDKIVLENLVSSRRLRSLTVFSEHSPSYISERMEVLRVLDLENAMPLSDEDMKKIGKLPPRLKFLSLRGHEHINSLPDSLGLVDLVQLQTLDVRGTSIRRLPSCIIKLKKLQYIRAGTSITSTEDATSSSSSWSVSSLVSCFPNFLATEGAIELPRGVRRLEALRTLGAVSINTIHVRVKFPKQLRKVEVSGINRNNRRWLFWSLSRCVHLESLSLKFEKKDHDLQWEVKNFRELKVLKIACSSSLNVTFGEGMKKLETLNFHCCSGSLMQLRELKLLGSLKVVRFSDALKEIVREQLHNHQNEENILQQELPRSSGASRT